MINPEKKLREAFRRSSSGYDKGGQCKNDRGKWNHDKEKPNGGDNNGNHNNFVK